MDLEQIYEEAKQAIEELAAVAGLQKGKVLVIGCSTSEIDGEKIGSASHIELAEPLYRACDEVAKSVGFDVAFQCCEHLNRAIIIEREVAHRLGLEEVNVVPQKKAGGSMATTAYHKFLDPIAVEYIQADAAIDIGETLIGMHVRPVVVPVRLSVKHIGKARVTAARRRPKFIGGERAIYKTM